MPFWRQACCRSEKDMIVSPDKMHVTYLSRIASLLLVFSSVPLFADSFSLTVSHMDMLDIIDSKGVQAAELPVPSLSQVVTVGANTVQISYGRDAYDQLTVILVPNPSAPQDLHFNALGRDIDSDKDAIVTLTFAKDMSAVRIDPGATGEVDVNSRRIRDVRTFNAVAPGQEAPEPVVHHHKKKTTTTGTNAAPMTNGAPMAPRATPSLAPPSVP